MLVSVQSGMFEYILSTQTVSIMNLEEILYHSTTEYSDTENESNDEYCLRKVKMHSSRTTHSHFANLFHFVRWLTKHIVTPLIGYKNVFVYHKHYFHYSDAETSINPRIWN